MLELEITLFFWIFLPVQLYQPHRMESLIWKEDSHEEGYHQIAGRAPWISVHPARIIEPT